MLTPEHLMGVSLTLLFKWDPHSAFSGLEEKYLQLFGVKKKKKQLDITPKLNIHLTGFIYIWLAIHLIMEAQPFRHIAFV